MRQACRLARIMALFNAALVPCLVQAAAPPTGGASTNSYLYEVDFSGLAQTYDGTPKAPAVTTTPTGLPLTLTYNQSTALPTNAGTYVVVATIVTMITNTLTISPVSATVQLSNLTQTYSGAPENPTVTTTPPGLPVTLTYNQSANPPTNAGTYAVVATVVSPNYTGRATNTFTISPASATILLSKLAQTYDGTPKTPLVSTTPAGLPVTLTYNQSANPPTNAGSYVVVATVANPNYTGSATNALIISPASATVLLSNLAQTYDGTAKMPAVTTTPAGLPVTLTYNQSFSAPTNPGSYTVVAVVASPNYTGGTTNTLIISPAAPFPEATYTSPRRRKAEDGEPMLPARDPWRGSTLRPTGEPAQTRSAAVPWCISVGTFTNALTVNRGGAANSPITIYFEPGANITMPAIPATGAINCGGYSFLTINGGVNGLIGSTANGTGMPNQVNSAGVYCEGSAITGVTIQNLAITNLYARTPGSTDLNSSGHGIYAYADLTNVVVRNCAISQCEKCIFIIYATGANHDLECYSNRLSHCNWGIGVGDGYTNAVLDGLYIYNNAINVCNDWEAPADNFHHDGIYAFAENARSYATNVWVCNNVIGPYFGSNVTAAIYLSSVGGAGIYNASIYNNVLFTSTNKPPSNGFIDASHVHGGCVYNNTINANGYGGIGLTIYSGTNVSIVNNIISGTTYPIYEDVANSVSFCDYNDYYFNSKAMGYYYSGRILNYASWQGLGYDAHSVTGTPNYYDSTVSDFRLLPGSQAIGTGENESALFTTDILGAARPQSGGWDMGAYQMSY